MHTHVLEETVSLPSDTSAEVNAFTDTPTGTGTGTDTDTDTHSLSLSLLPSDTSAEVNALTEVAASWRPGRSFCVSICTFGPASASVFVLLY